MRMQKGSLQGSLEASYHKGSYCWVTTGFRPWDVGWPFKVEGACRVGFRAFRA